MKKNILILTIILLFINNENLKSQIIYAGEDVITCDNSINLNAVNVENSNQYWSILSGFCVFENISSPTTLITELQQDTNILVWNVEINNLIYTDTVIVYYNYFEVNAGVDINTLESNCFLNATELQENQIGSWIILSGSGNILNRHNPQTNVESLLYGTSIFRWNVYDTVFSCLQSDDVSVTSGIFNNPCFAGHDQIICSDTTSLHATFIATTNLTYWSIISGNCRFEDISNCKSKIYNIQQGENLLLWTVEKNGYICTDTVAIYNNYFDVFAGNDQNIDDNFTSLDASIYNENYESVWSISQGFVEFENINNPKTIIYNIAEGENILKFSVKNTITLCEISDFINIKYIPLNNINLYFEQVEIYPNPTKDYIIIKLPEIFENTNITIINSEGKVLNNFNTFSSFNKIDILDNIGFYYVEITTNSNKKIYKVIKN